MRNFFLAMSAATLALAACSSGTTEAPEAVKEVVKETVEASKANLCTDMGPQTPRDISSVSGKNLLEFAMAPESSQMNLCNIHTHTNASIIYLNPNYYVQSRALDVINLL